MPVPFFRLELNDDDIGAVEAVLRSGWLTTGTEAVAFEQEFAARIGSGVEAIAVNSNTSGMHLALEAAGVGPGDQVIVPVLTFTATAEVVRYLGADPIFVDVDPQTLCIDPHRIEAALTRRTKAIMPVHFGGLAADMEAIAEIARRHGLHVIEDAAHAFPATRNGAMIGSLSSTATVFSFYANKTITTGEGGMIVTADPAIAARCRVMRLHGIDRDAFNRFRNGASWQYDVIAPGFKYNLTDIAAALGRRQLAQADHLRNRREYVAARYDDAFSALPLIRPSPPLPGDLHAWHLYVIQAGAPLGREGLERCLRERGIGYSVHYTPLHRLTYWRDRYDLNAEMFPVAEAYFNGCVSLPLFPAMTDEEIDEVIDAIHYAAETQGRIAL